MHGQSDEGQQLGMHGHGNVPRAQQPKQNVLLIVTRSPREPADHRAAAPPPRFDRQTVVRPSSREREANVLTRGDTRRVVARSTPTPPRHPSLFGAAPPEVATARRECFAV